MALEVTDIERADQQRDVKESVQRDALERIAMLTAANLGKRHVFESPPRHPGDAHDRDEGQHPQRGTS